jgi:hypothetical protein
MILGKSSYHVNQDEGKFYSKDSVKGYYNNLTEKITRFGKPGVLIPKTVVDTGEEIFFPIAIFQYGLAAYDLYLDKSNDEMKNIVSACADWAVKNQDEQGRWNTFSYENPSMPYSSMAQAEGISLLIRAKHLLNSSEYDATIHRAFEYMIKPIEDGGTTKYVGKKVYFYECPADPLILNGWIFSIWGLWDYVKEYKDSKAEDILYKTLKTLEDALPEYDLGYWSKYEDDKRISSPFYHSLHIAQLNVMYDWTGKEVYKKYADCWLMYKKSFFCPKWAFVKKALQKVLE